MAARMGDLLIIHRIITTGISYSHNPYTGRFILKSFFGKEGCNMKKTVPSPTFLATIEKAALTLAAGNFKLSREIITCAMSMDMDAPEPHNLLGILYELTGDDAAARQHYRAAYALDPTYKPSCRNLERLALYGFNVTGSIDYGVPAVPVNKTQAQMNIRQAKSSEEVE